MSEGTRENDMYQDMYVPADSRSDMEDSDYYPSFRKRSEIARAIEDMDKFRNGGMDFGEIDFLSLSGSNNDNNHSNATSSTDNRMLLSGEPDLFAKTTTTALIYSGFFFLLGGPENLPNRELSESDLYILFDKNIFALAEVIDKAIKSPNARFQDIDSVYDEAIWLARNHMFTSGAAVQNHFYAPDAAILKAEFNLGSGIGNEVPEADMPSFCQNEIMSWLNNVYQDLFSGFLSKHDSDGFLRANEILCPSEFNIFNISLFLDRLSAQVKVTLPLAFEDRSSHYTPDGSYNTPPHLDENALKELLEIVKGICDNVKASKMVSTKYMRRAAKTAMKLSDLLRCTKFKKTLLHLLLILRNWDMWSQEDIGESMAELSRHLAPLILAINEALSEQNRRSSEGSQSPPTIGPFKIESLKVKMKAICLEILEKRWKNRVEVGQQVVAHIKEVFKGSAKEFAFPTTRKPRYATEPAKNEEY